MIKPILACIDPYKSAEEFINAGWKLDFSQPPESGDPLVGVSLCGTVVSIINQSYDDLSVDISQMTGYTKTRESQSDAVLQTMMTK